MFLVIGEVPLKIDVREGSDCGQPVAIAQPDGALAQVYNNIAQEIWTRVVGN